MALKGLLRLTNRVSFDSGIMSPLTLTGMVFVVCPGPKVSSVRALAVQSPGAVAELSAVW